jgi:hypothetical protein
MQKKDFQFGGGTKGDKKGGKSIFASTIIISRKR